MEEGGDANRSSDLRYRRERAEKNVLFRPRHGFFSSNVVVDVVVVRRNSEFNVSRTTRAGHAKTGTLVSTVYTLPYSLYLIMQLMTQSSGADSRPAAGQFSRWSL